MGGRPTRAVEVLSMPEPELLVSPEPIVGYRMWRLLPNGDLAPMCHGRLANYTDDHARTMQSMLDIGYGWDDPMNELWPKNANYVARCGRHALLLGGPSHTSPSVDCSCGIYALKSMEDLANVSGDNAWSIIHDYGSKSILLAGKVWLWGKVLIHAQGYRAQYACIKRITHIATFKPRLIGPLYIRSKTVLDLQPTNHFDEWGCNHV